jgi:hypothetical protein
MAIIDEKYINLNEINSLSFDELFNIANKYRRIKTIPKDEIVVVLTNIKHNLQWFSGTSNRNIFVDTRGWEYITESDSKYGIAYQIVENIFQSLIGIEYNNAVTDPNVHQVSKGCINDMCKSKLDVILKLRSAYICVPCQQRAINMNVSRIILLQIISTIQRIRDGLMNFDLVLQGLEPQLTIVDKDGGVRIGENDIKLQAIPKALFIFFLANIDGVRVDSLDEKEHKEKLLAIYRSIRKGGKIEAVDSLCLPQTNPGSTFPKVRTETNKFLINTLDKVLSEFYVINNVRGPEYNFYKIQLPLKYLTFELAL